MLTSIQPIQDGGLKSLNQIHQNTCYTHQYVSSTNKSVVHHLQGELLEGARGLPEEKGQLGGGVGQEGAEVQADAAARDGGQGLQGGGARRFVVQPLLEQA